MCVTNCYDMTLAVKVVLNPNLSNKILCEFDARMLSWHLSHLMHLRKSSQWLWKEKLCQCWSDKARKRIDLSLTAMIMTLAIEMALNSNTNKTFTTELKACSFFLKKERIDFKRKR